MTTSNEEAPAQRCSAGGDRENHEGAGLTERVTRDAGNYHDLIRRIVDEAPEFSPAIRSRLAVLLRPNPSAEVAG